MSNEIDSENIDYERLKEIQSRLNKFTIPLFYVRKNLRPELAATGFFLKKEENLYLITASHVFDGLADQSDINFNIGGSDNTITTLPCGSKVYRSDKEISSNLMQSLDIAVVPIIKGSKVYRMFQQDAIDIKSTMYQKKLPDIDIHFLQGYPVSINKFAKCADLENDSLMVKPHGYPFQFSDLQEFEAYNKDPSTHYAIEWISKIDGNKTTHPRGCSGAGYWFFPDKHDLRKMLLAGVFIEYYKDTDLGFVTKIDEVVKFIAKINSK